MKEDLYYKGYWWISEQPENKVAGILSFKPSLGIKLELIGSFEKMEDTHQLFLDCTKEKFIYGETEDAKHMTLIDCFRFSKLNFACSFPMISYTVNCMLIGIHLSNLNDKIFNKLNVRMPLLTYWINRSGFKFSIPYSSEKAEGYDISYRINDQLDIDIPIIENFSISLNHASTAPDIYKEKSLIEQFYNLSITSQTSVTYNDLLKKAWRFKTFLSIATLTENDFTSLVLYSPDLYEEVNFGEKIYDKIMLIFYQSDLNEDYTKKHSPENFLFTYAKVSKEFPHIIQRWFSFDKEMLPIINHLVESIKTNRVFRSVDFLIVAQALEGYHHRFFDKEKEKNKRLESRLKNLLNEFRDIKAIGKIDLKAVEDSRNYYSHLFSSTKKDRIKTGKELYMLMKNLRILLICCLLKEIGFNNITINKLLRDTEALNL